MNNLNFALIVRILNATKAELWDGTGIDKGNLATYTCIAVSRAADKITGERGLARAERGFIGSKIIAYIGGEYTFEAYYAKKNGLADAYGLDKALMQAGRLEMLEALISYATPLAVLQNAIARLWDGRDDKGLTMEYESATYMCHAVTYAAVDLLGISNPGGVYNWKTIEAAQAQYVVWNLHKSIKAKIDGHGTADSYYRETFGDCSNAKLQAFRATTLTTLFAEYSEKTGV